MPDCVITIAGVEHTIQHETLDISATLSGRHTLDAELLSLDASYRPAKDDEILVVEALGTSATSLTVGTGSQSLTTQAGLNIVTGQRVRIYRAAAHLTYMEGAVTSYSGTTLVVNVDATNGAGTATDWVVGWRKFGGFIHDPEERGFGHTGASDAIVTRIRAADFNGLFERRYIWGSIPPGTLKAALTNLQTFLTEYSVVLDPAQVNGPSLDTVFYDWETLLSAKGKLEKLSAYVIEIDYYKILRGYAPGTLSAPINVIDGDGHAEGDITVVASRVNYANWVLVVYNDKTAYVQAKGVGWDTTPWMALLLAPEIKPDETATPPITAADAEASAQALADAYLAEHQIETTRVRYATREPGLLPGRTQTITIARRNLDNTFLIEDVDTVNDAGNLLLTTVTALEGTAAVRGDNWRDVYRQWSGGSAVSVAGGAGGGGGSGPAVARRVYPLGGSTERYVQSAGPDWITVDEKAVGASGHQVVIDTVAIGTTTVAVTLTLRATAGTVSARLRNISDGVTVGTLAAPVGTTTWSRVTFSAVLTAGSKVYELHLLPSLANTDVGVGTAYVE